MRRRSTPAAPSPPSVCRCPLPGPAGRRRRRRSGGGPRSRRCPRDGVVTHLDVLLDAVCNAMPGLPPPRKPWREMLPEELDWSGVERPALHGRRRPPRALRDARHARRPGRAGAAPGGVRPRGGRRPDHRRQRRVGQDHGAAHRRPRRRSRGDSRRGDAVRHRLRVAGADAADARPAPRGDARHRRRRRVDHAGDHRAHRRARPPPAAAHRPRRAGREPLGVPRQGPLAAADRRARRRLPEPPAHPRHRPAEEHGPLDWRAEFQRIVTDGRQLGHPRRDRRRPPPGDPAVADVGDRQPSRPAPDRRSAATSTTASRRR